jgi:hypothetical protein
MIGVEQTCQKNSLDVDGVVIVVNPNLLTLAQRSWVFYLTEHRSLRLLSHFLRDRHSIEACCPKTR